MVNDNAFRGGGDLSVHKNFCSSAKTVSGAFGVIVVAVKFYAPSVKVDLFIIVRVNYREFALCQANLSEGVAVTQASI